MAIKVNCEKCGKFLVFPASDAGQKAVCNACGARFQLPAEVPIPHPPLPQVPGAAAALAQAPSSMGGRSSAPEKKARVPEAVTERSRSRGRWWVAAAVVAVAAAAAVPLVLRQRGVHTRAALIPSRPAPSLRPAVAKSPTAKPSTRAAIVSLMPKLPQLPPAWTVRPAIAGMPVAGSEPPATQRVVAEVGLAASQPATAPVAVAAAALPPRPRIHRMPLASLEVTDEQIGRAIQRAADFILKQADTNSPPPPVRRGGGRDTQRSGYAYYTGRNALYVYALLQAGQAINDDRLSIRAPLMKRAISILKEQSAESGPITYARGIRATALALFNRPEDQLAMRADVNWLIKAGYEGGGAYNYAGTGPGDNSNSQYGLLGVWSGAEAGLEVPQRYWELVEKHWDSTQYADGQWGYRRGMPPRLSMTVAGIASLFVAHDYLDIARFGAEVGRDPFSPALARGLAWLEDGDNAVNIEGPPGPMGLRGSSHYGYTLYGLERVGLASGFKYFGKHDWYKELAAQLLAEQADNGSWDDPIETAYILLFLARGRHPVLMNKLRFDGYWSNRPRDVANLARFASRELERPLNWQVVSLNREWYDWLDSPILYLASHTQPKFTDEDFRKLRQFVQAGGLLFTQADGDRLPFNDFAETLRKKLFPEYEWTNVPPDHAIFHMLFNVGAPPPLRMVSNGSRILMLHSPTDVSEWWQMRADLTKRWAFELGVNLFLYSAGKTDLRNRLASPYLPKPLGKPTGTFPVARLRYAGNWDPEPAAWYRAGRALLRDTSLAVELVGDAKDNDSVALENLSPATAPLAILTGTSRYTFTDAQVAAVRNFVRTGGVLFIDPCGGPNGFLDGVETSLLSRAFPEILPKAIPVDHPLLSPGGDGMSELSRPRFRPYTTERQAGAALQYVRPPGARGCVILSPLDITTGLLATNTWSVLGYDPGYCQSFVQNLVLWTWDGAPETSPTTAPTTAPSTAPAAPR